MYPSLFFGEPSQAFYLASRAKLYGFKNRAKTSLIFSSELFWNRNKSNDIEFQDFHWDNNGPKKFLLKSILQVPRKSFLPGLYWYSTQYDEVPVFIFKTDIDWPWLFADLTAIN